MNDTNAKCPACGYPAYQGLSKIECTRLGCTNFKAPVPVPYRAPERTPLGADGQPLQGRLVHEQAHAPAGYSDAAQALGRSDRLVPGSALKPAPPAPPTAAELQAQLHSALTRAGGPNPAYRAVAVALASVFAAHFKTLHTIANGPHNPTSDPETVSGREITGEDVRIALDLETQERREIADAHVRAADAAVRRYGVSYRLSEPRPRCGVCSHAKEHPDELRADLTIPSMCVCRDVRGCGARVRARMIKARFVQLPPAERAATLERLGGTWADELRVYAERFDAAQERRRAALARRKHARTRCPRCDSRTKTTTLAGENKCGVCKYPTE